MSFHEVTLRAAPEADAGRAVIRLPSDMMAALAISPGDAVAVRGKALTHCRAVRAASGGDAVELDPAALERIGASDTGRAEIAVAALPTANSVLLTLDGAEIRVRPADLSESLFDLPLTLGDRLMVPSGMGQSVPVVVTEITPGPAAIFSAKTILSVGGQPAPAPVFEGIGGLEEQIARVQEMVATPLARPELFERLGVPPPRGILFTGPPGSGKTLLARAVAARTSAAFFHINAPEIVSKHYGDSEAALRQVFDAAARKSPAIIFIDEIDAVAPRRDALSGEKQVERRVVAQLLTLLDGLSDRGRIVVMAATNLPDSIDPALRRPGRLEREVVFRPPNRAERRDILSVHLGQAPLDAGVDLDAIAEASHGYVGADLAALAREAALAALARSVRAAGGEDMVSADDLVVSAADLETGLALTRPAILRDTVVDSPTVRWSDIGGLDDVKAALEEAVVWPIRHKDSFRSLRVPAARGVILAGPPGSGKTLLARGLAGESGLNFVGVRPTRILSQFLGEAERAVAELFAKARQAAPAILFFDEFDALARRRTGQDAVLDRIVGQLLVEMDGLSPNDDVVVLAATNRPNAIDPALLRPGRIDHVLTVPLPDAAARRAILDVHFQSRSVEEGVDLSALVGATDGFSGADLASLAQSAARQALRRHLSGSDLAAAPAIGAADIDAALVALRRRASDVAVDHLRQVTEAMR
ncbi:AAA family ATPase [Alphaproteobacteria bacterium GH1-50]|uniref:AAA family ATPase n=1 Tax=Kangsaoukella pontilimi TaxID=2691042 RepID=A0A7C9N026_9RHOB|nr:AAA family ATPase [Kangsaoukella pontilimi]MXQ07938.1 AAA family ATPase [Kangsaoukella pontilimi]